MNLKSKLKQRTPLLGTFVKTPSPAICEALGRSEFDLVCLDAEHAPFSRGSLDQCVLACRSVDLPAVIRIPANRPEHILNALDIGANGIIAPHLMNAAQSKDLVNKATYSRGRGYAGRTRSAGAKTMPEIIKAGQENTVIIGQIEDAEALDTIDEILSVDGIDCFFIGRSDLTISMGLTDPFDPKVKRALEIITEKARSKNRCIGTFTSRLGEIPYLRSLGISLFLLGSDQSLMLNGATELNKTFREFL